MKSISVIAAALAFASAGNAFAQDEAMHVVTAATTHWMPAPPSLPNGAEIALVAGDPSKPGPFAFRLRMPARYKIALHTHPTAEYVTMISGQMLHGMSADRSAARRVDAGDFLYLPPRMAHALWSGSRPAVLQVNGTGPFAITYVDPTDDPRKK